MATNYAPSAPTDRRVNPALHSAVVSGVIFNPQGKTPEKARLEVEYSKSSNMGNKKIAFSSMVDNGMRATVTLTGLDSGTRYYLRMWSRDAGGNRSNSYASEDFRTDGTFTPSVSTGSTKQHAPQPPTDIKVNGEDAVDEQVTRSTGSVSVSALVDDPDEAAQKVRLVVFYAQSSDFSSGVQKVESNLVPQESRASVVLSGLVQNTLYHLRMYARDSRNLLSNSYTTTTFWTNRSPSQPNVLMPPENADTPRSSPLPLVWQHQDPDEPGAASQGGYVVQVRRASTVRAAAGPWQQFQAFTETQSHTLGANTLLPNTYYEWQVATRDPQGAWGPFSDPRSFFVTGTSAPPIPLGPFKGEAVDVTEPTTFTWQFRDPDPGNFQVRADLRYRVVGATDWHVLTGDTTTPGGEGEWTLDAETFFSGFNYEWQVRTYDDFSSSASEWSESANFWTIRTPGTGAPEVAVPTYTQASEGLGCGTHRAFIYQRGGNVLIGEVTPITSLRWNRKRDDITDAEVLTTGFGIDCGELLQHVEPWLHELVLFRDGVRVWEGPITLVTMTDAGVVIGAKDVMAWVYRRIMRQGYDDSYRIVSGQQLGLKSVVERAERLIMNALAPDDPNILPYLTTFKYADDARQSRVKADFSSTVWEEVDDLAATAGLDYTTVGRRIMLWDVHRYIGRLPELRDVHFSDPPVVSKYGMQLATDFGVTNNNGVWGLASRPEGHGSYGLIEQLASAYGETDSGAAEEVLTQQARIALEATLTSQAERNIRPRYPTPVIVRVPDNSTLSPETPVTINQLVPGVWIPLRSQGPTWNLAQWQKLDLVTVTQTERGEQVQVTMSPAPNSGEDPDAENAPED